MAMVIDASMTRAFTVSADHLLCRYDFAKVLALDGAQHDRKDIMSSYSVKRIGNASLALSHDSRVVAVGGWDGR